MELECHEFKGATCSLRFCCNASDTTKKCSVAYPTVNFWQWPQRFSVHCTDKVELSPFLQLQYNCNLTTTYRLSICELHWKHKSCNLFSTNGAIQVWNSLIRMLGKTALLLKNNKNYFVGNIWEEFLLISIFPTNFIFIVLNLQQQQKIYCSATPLHVCQVLACHSWRVQCKQSRSCSLDHVTLNAAWTTPCLLHPDTSEGELRVSYSQMRSSIATLLSSCHLFHQFFITCS